MKSSVYRYEKDDSDNEENPIDEGEELENFEDEDNIVIQLQKDANELMDEVVEENYDIEMDFFDMINKPNN